MYVLIVTCVIHTYCSFRARQQKGTRNDVESAIPRFQRSNRATVKLSGRNKRLSSSSSPSHELSRNRAKSVPHSHDITLEDKDSLTSRESSSTSLSASFSFPTIKGSSISTTDMINESHRVNTREQDNSRPVSSNSRERSVPPETSSPPLQMMDKPPSSPPKSPSKIYTGPVDMDTPPVPPQRIIKTSPESSSSPIEQLREILSTDWNETRSHDSILPSTK